MSKSGSAAEDVKDIIIKDGIGYDPVEDPKRSWIVNVQQVVADPNNLIIISDYSLKNAEHCMNKLGIESEVEYKGVQAQVRSDDYLSGYKKLEEIRQRFCNTGNEDSIDGIYRYSFMQKSDIIPLGDDEGNNRQILAINFMATRTRN